jgi:hypothetical protein
MLACPDLLHTVCRAFQKHLFLSSVAGCCFTMVATPPTSSPCLAAGFEWLSPWHQVLHGLHNNCCLQAMLNPMGCACLAAASKPGAM